MELVHGTVPVIIAEQNNGYIWHELGRAIMARRPGSRAVRRGQEDVHMQVASPGSSRRLRPGSSKSFAPHPGWTNLTELSAAKLSHQR
jgi:hypothetical protein